ncbi:putative sporulation protein YtaF [Clostridium sporogenes]|uniref:sporulation membrane protein YtaF n=1 Tax=Clostridium TaxID=1485 RepID=UPI0005F92665|nr:MULTISPECIES: sporulation membrane protein YtaF [Clostridium]APF26942.1 putative sporulation protein YtaF [Clostridium sporogenes]MDI6919292.1 sporulation membrane protein YtaF [Clostridium botulinum]WMU99321.1 sporulation membrane protein YtaF [Clostridium botulinum]
MIESLLLVLAVSLDAFVASIAYGTNKIKIPFISATIINIVCSSVLGVSLFLGSVIKKFIPVKITSIISFIILCLFGIYYLFDSMVKNYVKKNRDSNKKLKIKFSDLSFIIDICIDETKADVDHSKILSPKEALYLSTALSLDSLAIGLGSSLGNVNYMQIIILSLISDFVFVYAGAFVGRKFVEKSKFSLSWLSGIILIVLAVMRII